MARKCSWPAMSQIWASDEEAVDEGEEVDGSESEVVDDSEEAVESLMMARRRRWRGSEKAAAQEDAGRRRSRRRRRSSEKAAAQENARSSRTRVGIILSPVDQHGSSRNTQQYTNNQIHIWAGCGN
uniref:Uncharacterized protein n=1 Tax=Oryza punctata TaxID=4537 RepID=A0A0E0MLV6_ORYPU